MLQCRAVGRASTCKMVDFQFDSGSSGTKYLKKLRKTNGYNEVSIIETHFISKRDKKKFKQKKFCELITFLCIRVIHHCLFHHINILKVISKTTTT